MRTICSFVENRRNEGRRNNPVFTRSMGRVGFVDYGYSGTMPLAGEHWLVSIQRENLSSNGGSFVIRPLEKIKEVEPLQINGYTLLTRNDAVIVLPKQQGNWVMSPSAKASILTASPNCAAIVISMDGDTQWERRAPPENLLTKMASNLLGQR